MRERNIKVMLLITLFIFHSIQCTAIRKKNLSEFEVQVFYLPFGVLTYLPVTKNNIEKKADYKIIVHKQIEIEKIEHLYNPIEDTTFASDMIRAKVILNKDTTFIDFNGNTINTSGKKFKVVTSQFEKEIMKLVGRKSILNKH
jgi:hypothetical protein